MADKTEAELLVLFADNVTGDISELDLREFVYSADVDTQASHILNTSNPHSVTATQVGNTNAQWNAYQLQGYDISSASLGAGQDGYVLTWNNSTSEWEAAVANTVGGSDTEVQFNDAGTQAGDSDFAWDKTGNILTVTGQLKQVDGSEASGYVLASDANGLATWTDPASLVSGLDYWTESNSTYDSIEFTKWTPSSASTNVAIVIQPKGDRGIQAQESDGTAAGGNNRGINSVDLQTYRSAATQVASGSYSVISGGSGNIASDSWATVGGGRSNSASGSGSFIGGGNGNKATAYNGVVCGGGGIDPNYAYAEYAFIGGGRKNRIDADRDLGVICGGYYNEITYGTHGFIGGGQGNDVTAYHAVVCCGRFNKATGNNSVICGGYENEANGYISTVCGGGGLGNGNIAESDYAFIGGGSSNNISAGTHSSIVGGNTNNITAAIGSGHFIGGGDNNSMTASGVNNVIVGGQDHIIYAVGSIDNAFIGGGKGNYISADYGFIGGGSNNIASGAYSFIGGGYGNSATGEFSFVGTGGSITGPNTAGQLCAVVGGGGNSATGSGGFIGGGYYNTITGEVNGNDARCFIGAGQSNTIGVLVTSTFSFNNVTPDTITRASGSFVTDGFLAGARIQVTGSVSNNGNFTIATVAALTLTLISTDSLTTELSAAGVTIRTRNAEAVIGGGIYNVAQGTQSTVAGGRENKAVGLYATVGGGLINIAQGARSVVAGGTGNRSIDDYGFIGGGSSNRAGRLAVVCGGGGGIYPNYSYATAGFLGGGYGNLVQAARTCGTICGGQSNEIKTYGTHGFIGGGIYNDVTASHGVVCGGSNNGATESYASAVVGGRNNVATGYCAFIGGGAYNDITASREFSVICGGEANEIKTAGTHGFIGGGYINDVTAGYAVVCGGFTNTASGIRSVVCGGANNIAGPGNYCFVGSGAGNIVTGDGSAIVCGGGFVGNYVYSTYSFIGCGQLNNIEASRDFSAIVGGQFNEIKTAGTHGFIGGGKYNDVTSGYAVVCGGLTNSASGASSFVGGGGLNTASGNQAVVCGGGGLYGNTASGPWSVVVGGAGYNVAAANSSFIGGGYQNSIAASRTYGVICGGANNEIKTAGTHGFIGGGNNNDVTAAHAVVCGGYNNAALDIYTTVCGGRGNQISNLSDGYGFIGGGYLNSIGGGTYGTISGGHGNYVSGSIAWIGGGRAAVANKHGQHAHAAGRIFVDGDAQGSHFILRREVTHSDANWYELFLDGASDQLTLASNSCWTFTVLITGGTDGLTKSFGFKIDGMVENDGGTTTIKSSTVTTIDDADDVSFDARVTADDTNDALKIEVSDSDGASDTVRWVAHLTTVEMIYAGL